MADKITPKEVASWLKQSVRPVGGIINSLVT